ncbi:MAG TPA: type V CRISPR-associated protein Cas12b [Bacilli bacterium]
MLRHQPTILFSDVHIKEQGNPLWVNEKAKWEKQKQQNPLPEIMNRLEAWGLKPLIPLFTDTQQHIKWLPKKAREFVRTWDRDMFQQAIEQLLSWESWNDNLMKEALKLKNEQLEIEEKYFSDLESREWLQEMRAFEEKRAKELAIVSFAPTGTYRLLRRELRGWEQVSAKWIKLVQKGEINEEAYKRIVAKTQTEHRKEFGDPQVYAFLAKPENHHLWQTNPERMKYLVALNTILHKLDQTKSEAEFTLPDAVKHPKWLRFDARGGNLQSLRSLPYLKKDSARYGSLGGTVFFLY